MFLERPGLSSLPLRKLSGVFEMEIMKEERGSRMCLRKHTSDEDEEEDLERA